MCSSCAVVISYVLQLLFVLPLYCICLSLHCFLECTSRVHLLVGLSRLSEVNSLVGSMQVELVELGSNIKSKVKVAKT